MGLISFIREKGEKLLGRDGSEAKAATGATGATGATSAGDGSTARAAGTPGAAGQPAGTNLAAPAGGLAQSGSATAGAGHSQVQDAAAARAIESYIAAMNLSANDLQVVFDPSSATVTVSGEAPDQATREKIVLCCGNVTGVEKVDDRMTVARSEVEAEAALYTVVEGDSLSKIAKQQYGNANAYMAIFEANQPMLKHPDKIYPGQVLRIPPKGQ
jgi:nucleoid-associated protein YgaU